MYTYIGVYYVKNDFIEEFEKIYGTAGAWVQLIKGADGYNGGNSSATVTMKEGT